MRIYSNFGLIFKLVTFRGQAIRTIFIYWDSKDMGSKLSFMWLKTMSHDYNVINRRFIEGTQKTKLWIFSNLRWLLTKWSSVLSIERQNAGNVLNYQSYMVSDSQEIVHTIFTQLWIFAEHRKIFGIFFR